MIRLVLPFYTASYPHMTSLKVHHFKLHSGRLNQLEIFIHKFKVSPTLIEFQELIIMDGLAHYKVVVVAEAKIMYVNLQ